MAESDDAIRLFHGRGQCFSGFEYFTVDYFAPVLWVVLYREPEAEFWAEFCSQLTTHLASSVGVAAVQHRYQRDAELDLLWGELPERPVAKEHNLVFQLQFGGRQNIGYFMDMQPARQWLRPRSKGKRILNLFSYTCAFSVAAAAEGAERVVNVDMSKSALRTGRVNHQLSGLEFTDTEVVYLGHDIFRSWGRIKKMGPYDLVICDPPSRQAGSFEVRKDYPRLLRKMPELLAEGGEALICLNAPYLDTDFLQEMVAEHWPEGQFIERLPGRKDFPESDAAASLKVLSYKA
ncbi:class I SAM-dependent methyltransferase [Spongiibacter sp. KMU-158]|uniref:Class I SAM-dependent methyltransferase n=1 Tax=Spongiibacter pelagi TaxID=2760804 RepID=A0A927GWZ9_9GAMM|nr:class I SAM-dependent methyltransferase [Spongiibacter pelagi]